MRLAKVRAERRNVTHKGTGSVVESRELRVVAGVANSSELETKRRRLPAFVHAATPAKLRGNL
jgi:hypothetical protein